MKKCEQVLRERRDLWSARRDALQRQLAAGHTFDGLQNLAKMEAISARVVDELDAIAAELELELVRDPAEAEHEAANKRLADVLGDAFRVYLHPIFGISIYSRTPAATVFTSPATRLNHALVDEIAEATRVFSVKSATF